MFVNEIEDRLKMLQYLQSLSLKSMCKKEIKLFKHFYLTKNF